MTGSGHPPLRFTTWLAPGLPVGMFETIADHVSRGLGYDHVLHVEPRISGPLSEADDLFAQGLTDIGFVCPPPYLWLAGRATPSVRLVPLAPIHDDPRNQGRPIYMSDIVVRADSGIGCFADLAGARVGFNEHASLSGFVSLLDRLDTDGLGLDFFADLCQVGSHRRALELIEAGEIDAAAIDANVWRAWGNERTEGRPKLRAVDVLGPYPVQPIVVRASAEPELVDALAAELARPELAAALRPFGITGFGSVTAADYEALAPTVERALALVPN